VRVGRFIYVIMISSCAVTGSGRHMRLLGFHDHFR
jgi:hypothetical protein